MENTYWLKQTDKPLFPDLLWSRPENKQRAGKLLIVGGNLHGFAAPGTAYGAALKAGIGTCRIIMPDSLKKIVIPHFSHFQSSTLQMEFAPSTISGSFSKKALAQILDNAQWADGVLLAGDFGKNSETAILLEKFVDKFDGQLTLSGDSVDYFLSNPIMALRRHNVIASNFGLLQKLVKPALIKHVDDLMNLVGKLHEITQNNKAKLITYHQGHIIAADSGQVSTTPSKEVNLVDIAAYASVWWLQQPQKPFEALVSAVFSYCSSAR